MLVLLIAACAHLDEPVGLKAARRLSSSAWLERITEPGHEVATLASLSMPARMPASGGKPWDFHGAPFMTTDGMSVYETYAQRDALGQAYRAYAKLQGGPCIDARALAREVGAVPQGSAHPPAASQDLEYRRDSGSTLLYLYARREDRCLNQVSARRKD
ncbi:MAG: hypothetical protein QM795_13320 [Pseudoxanthomonas sp.]